MDKPFKSLKYDPVTGAVAIRTDQPAESPSPFQPSIAWLIATPNSGAHQAGADVVGGWLDNFSVVDGQVVLPE